MKEMVSRLGHYGSGKAAPVRNLLLGAIMALVCMTTVFADEVSIKLSKDAPAVGQPLTAELSGIEASQVTLVWSVAGKETGVTGEQYTPSAADYEAWIEVAAYTADGEKLASDRLYFSPLPVVYIQTEEETPVTSRDTYIDADMRIQGSWEYAQQYDGKIEIKGRGTSSWHYDKKPYKIKLDKKTGLFGWDKNKHFVLLANYLDPSLLRNTEAFRLADYLGLTSMDTVWVDVVFNGSYVGNYQLCEHIRIGKGRVHITDWEDIAEEAADAIAEAEGMEKADKSRLEEAMTQDLSWITDGSFLFDGEVYEVGAYYELPTNTNGGFLFELGNNYTDEVSHFSTESGIGIAVSKPEYLATNEEMFTYAQDYFQRVEDALQSPNGYNEAGEHYTQLVDMDSIVSYWLVMEILSNEDAAGRSRYCYLDVDGKLTYGPVWDFDISSNSYSSFFGETGWNVTGTISGWYTEQDFWKDYVDDPYFQVKAQEKYWQIRDYLEELVREGGWIDQDASYLYESAVANEMLWTDGRSMRRSFTGSNGDVAIYREFLQARLRWLDMVFATEESTTRELCNYLSTNPYIPDKDTVLTLVNGTQDFCEHGATYRVETATDLTVQGTVPDGTEAALYVNGLYVGTYSPLELQTGVTVEEEAFTEPAGAKNVIELRYSSDTLSGGNYITVVIGDGQIAPQPFTPAETVSCSDGHAMEKLAAREADETQYGLSDCWYCSRCHHYFADCEGAELLAPEQVILSPVTSDQPGRRAGIEKVLKDLCRTVEKHVTEILGEKAEPILYIYRNVCERMVWQVSRNISQSVQSLLQQSGSLRTVIKSVVEIVKS